MIPLAWYDIMLKAVAAVLPPVLKKLTDMIFQPILDAIATAVQLVMGTIGTFWVYVNTPAVGDSTTGAPANGSVGWVWEHTQFIAASIALIGLTIAGAQMAWSHRGDGVRDILRSLITLGMASALSVGVAQLMIEFGDKFSDCLVTTALTDSGEGWQCGMGAGGGKAFGQSMTALLGLSAAAGPIGIGLAITIGILTVVAGVIQIVLMVVRSAMLILLLGVLPIAAAATNTEMGRGWFKKIISWLLAFILYKPVAAIVYATAIRLTSNNGAGLRFDIPDEDVATQVMNMVTGVTMLVLALFALPALMRFIVPMVGATASGAGAGALAAKLVGMDGLANKAQQMADKGGAEEGGGDGPTGAQNVGKPQQQTQSPGPSGGEAPAGEGASTQAASQSASSGAATQAGTTTAATSGTTTAAAGAGTGAAAALGPVGVAVVAGKAVFDTAKSTAEGLAGEATAGEGGGGQGGGGGGGGPSGSTGQGSDMSRSRPPSQSAPPPPRESSPPPEPEGPSGSS